LAQYNGDIENLKESDITPPDMTVKLLFRILHASVEFYVARWVTTLFGRGAGVDTCAGSDLCYTKDMAVGLYCAVYAYVASSVA
jgi:hypothetical protein